MKLAGEKPIVGETYMVPCFAGTPVVGETHTDNSHFVHGKEHYHCDSRFVESETQDQCGVMLHLNPDAKLTMEPRVCIRDTPVRPDNPAAWLAKAALYLDYGHCRVVNGRCPHKGMPIQNGVCSGHRMRFVGDRPKHKGPITLRIRGTKNEIVVTQTSEMDEMPIPITERFVGNVMLEFIDNKGELISERPFGYWTLEPGETLTIRPEERNSY